MTRQVTITIAVITYNRPESLAATLQSIKGLVIPAGVEVRLLVVDNDEKQTAKPVVDTMKQNFPMAAQYEVEPLRGIPHARNKVLSLAIESNYIAFIDDDDTADSNWLAALYDAMIVYEADVVKGQVVNHLPQGKEYLKKLDVFASTRQATGSLLTSAWTNNVLFATQIYKNRGLEFNPVFTKTGGSDHDFFRRAAEQGAKIIFCHEAVVNVKVPESRTTWCWLMRRNMRNGATMTRSDIMLKGYGYTLRQVAKAILDSLGYALLLTRGVWRKQVAVIHPFSVLCFLLGRISGLFYISPREYC